MIELRSCPKASTHDLDKALPPAETVARVKAIFAERGQGLLEETRRVDSGRLGIPVYVSMAGPKARGLLPTRKQMGKGATPEQAEASALMELVERISFFTFWQSYTNFTLATYSQAEERWPGEVMDIGQIIASVNEDIDPVRARRVLDLARWRFCRGTNLTMGREERAPFGWFKMLGEFNGSSAGNTQEESIHQGAAELIERHVCARVDRERMELPTIDPKSLRHPVTAGLLERFERHGVRVIMKDFSLGMPLPTVAALAWDPATFPGLSEIVFTAGTASTPDKAAIRALTEVAQLAGDFATGAVYEASGLPKFQSVDEFAWLERGPLVELSSLPSLEREDMAEELRLLAARLGEMGYQLYSVDIGNPALGLPAHYSFAPGFGFRERDIHASLGLFVGRYLAEEGKPEQFRKGYEVLSEVYPGAFFLPFFQGLHHFRQGESAKAREAFLASESLQPDEEKRSMAAFYAGYVSNQLGDNEGALEHLNRAVELSREVKEYFNQRGVALFKLGRYEEAARDFGDALGLDRGSAVDLANLGLCRLRLGDEAQGRDYLQTALDLDPSLDYAQRELDALGGREAGE